MKRVFAMIFGGAAMLGVAVLAAFLSMRVFIHGREVSVPNLAGKSDADAAKMARDLGLNLSVENRFYSSAVGPNDVLSQSPAAGSRVRRGWQVRVTESLGGQKVQVPDLTGQTERPASLVLRRLQLDLGTVAHLPAPGQAGIVLAQSPPPNSVGLNGPRVALLVADDESAASGMAYVMPQLVGMTLGAASLKLSTAGLHIASTQAPELVPDAAATAASGTVASGTAAGSVAGPPPGAAVNVVPGGSVGGSASAQTAGADVAVDVVPALATTSSVIVTQSPAPGRKVTRGDAIRVTLAQ